VCGGKLLAYAVHLLKAGSRPTVVLTQRAPTKRDRRARRRN